MTAAAAARKPRAKKPSAAERGKQILRTNPGAALSAADAGDVAAYVAALEKQLKIPQSGDEEDVKDAKRNLAAKIGAQMKWTAKCRTASAPFAVSIPMLNATFGEIFGAEGTLNPNELDEVLSASVHGSARYDDLYVHGPAKIKYDALLERITVSGRFGKMQAA